MQPGDDQASSPRLNAKSLVCRRSNVVGLLAWEDKAVADERGQRDDERKPPWFQTVFNVVGHAAAVFAVHAALVQLHQNRLGICTGQAEQPGNRHSHDGTRATHGDSGGDTGNTVDSNARRQGQSKGLEWRQAAITRFAVLELANHTRKAMKLHCLGYKSEENSAC